MAISFDLADVREREQLVELMREFYLGQHLDLRDDCLAALDQLLSNPNLGRVYLIRDGADVLGYFIVMFGFSLEHGGPTALLDELYVRRPMQGRGIGTTALKFAGELVRTQGCKVLQLEADRHNAGVQRLYRRLGFDDHGRDYLTLRLDPEE